MVGWGVYARDKNTSARLCAKNAGEAYARARCICGTLRYNCSSSSLSAKARNQYHRLYRAARERYFLYLLRKKTVHDRFAECTKRRKVIVDHVPRYHTKCGTFLATGDMGEESERMDWKCSHV